jgi:polysaccharide export outer membrane protein
MEFKPMQGERMGRRLLRGVLLAGCLLAGSVAWGQASAASGASGSAAPPNAAVDTMPATGGDYVIGADDVLHVSVWKEPDLTESLPVRADGKISLPLLGDVQAAGYTPTQLAGVLTDKLKKYLADPRVTVIVTAMTSKRIYVTGEVVHPGSMAMTPNMTVLQALAGAGFTQFANTKGIYILRMEDGKQKKMPVNYKKIVKGEVLDQNVVLRAGDTIVVP